MTQARGTSRQEDLALLYDLERVAQLPEDGAEPFHPGQDRDLRSRGI